jgi:HPt (histidine-containing phosphotransfer) domain-containing protein
MSQTMTKAQAPLGQAYDRDKLVELFGDDPVTLAEVEREFLDTARVAEREITGATDATTIARAAHRLKGASGMIGAASLRQIAEAVERAAKANDLPSVRRLHEMFSREVERVAEQVGVTES